MNFRRSMLGLCLCSGIYACHKAPPDENVHAGSSTAANAGAGNAGDGNQNPASRTDAGDSRDAEVIIRNDAGQVITILDDGAVRVVDSGPETSDAAVDAGPPPPPPPFTKPALLEAFAQCAIEHYAEFKTRAQALDATLTTLAADPSPAHFADGQDAWLHAMQSWERAELFRYGPAARSMNPGGQDLRDQIYIYPLANACKVDQQILDKTYAAGDFSGSNSSARGMSALEYLLFHGGTGNACAPSLKINKDGSWAALDLDELTTRRAKYAAAVSGDVLSRINTLVNAWDPGHGDFGDKLVHPGSGSPYATQQAAFNAVSDGLFYVEIELKDWKLAWPLGLTADCPNMPSTCPNDIESRYARVSTDHLRQNLIAARKLFEGCGAGYYGLGFDDWLDAVGSEKLAERMLTALRAAQRAVDDLSPPLEQAITSDPDKVREVFTKVKAFTDLLKTEMVSVLNLELPMGAEGDND